MIIFFFPLLFSFHKKKYLLRAFLPGLFSSSCARVQRDDFGKCNRVVPRVLVFHALRRSLFFACRLSATQRHAKRMRCGTQQLRSDALLGVDPEDLAGLVVHPKMLLQVSVIKLLIAVFAITPTIGPFTWVVVRMAVNEAPDSPTAGVDKIFATGKRWVDDD